MESEVQFQPRTLLEIAHKAIDVSSVLTDQAPSCCATGCGASVLNISHSYVFDKDIFCKEVLFCLDCKKYYHVDCVFIVLMYDINHRDLCLCVHCAGKRRLGTGQLKLSSDYLGVTQTVWKFQSDYDFNEYSCGEAIMTTMNHLAIGTEYIFKCKVENPGHFIAFNREIYDEIKCIEFTLIFTIDSFHNIITIGYDIIKYTLYDPENKHHRLNSKINSLAYFASDIMTHPFAFNVSQSYCCESVQNLNKQYHVLRNYSKICLICDQYKYRAPDERALLYIFDNTINIRQPMHNISDYLITAYKGRK